MKNDMKYLVPLKGLIVRDPSDLTPLPEGGAMKPWTTYWRKQFNDGSVTIGKPITVVKKREG